MVFWQNNVIIMFATDNVDMILKYRYNLTFLVDI